MGIRAWVDTSCQMDGAFCSKECAAGWASAFPTAVLEEVDVGTWKNWRRNQSEILARSACKDCGKPLAEWNFEDARNVHHGRLVGVSRFEGGEWEPAHLWIDPRTDGYVCTCCALTEEKDTVRLDLLGPIRSEDPECETCSNGKRTKDLSSAVCTRCGATIKRKCHSCFKNHERNGR